MLDSDAARASRRPLAGLVFRVGMLPGTRHFKPLVPHVPKHNDPGAPQEAKVGQFHRQILL